MRGLLLFAAVVLGGAGVWAVWPADAPGTARQVSPAESVVHQPPPDPPRLGPSRDAAADAPEAAAAAVELPDAGHATANVVFEVTGPDGREPGAHVSVTNGADSMSRPSDLMGFAQFDLPPGKWTARCDDGVPVTVSIAPASARDGQRFDIPLRRYAHHQVSG